MSVVDASVVVPALFDTEFLRHLLGIAPALVAPAILDLEVVSALRRASHRGLIEEDAAESCLSAFVRAPIERRDHAGLLPRIWELRHNLTPYDAVYVALAEALGVRLLTGDAKLASAAGLRCEVRLMRP